MRIFNGRGAAMTEAKARVKREGRKVTLFRGPNEDHVVVSTGHVAVADFPGGRGQWERVIDVVPNNGWWL